MDTPADFPEKLFQDPSLFVLKISERKNTAAIYNMARENYSRSSFLDDRLDSLDGIEHILPLSVLADYYKTERPSPRRINYIFHIATCGSTLLFRCLDQPGKCLPYKEPFILLEFCRAKRLMDAREERMGIKPSLNLLLALLGRTYSDSEIPVIKPSDSCNNMVRELVRHHPDSTGLLLYRDLKPFAISMLVYPNRRSFMRSCLHRSRMDLDMLGLLPGIQAEKLSDAQAAGFLWLSQMYQYLQLLGDGSLNILSLNAATFYNRPNETLMAITKHFHLDFNYDDIHKIVNSDIMRRDSKLPNVDYAVRKAQKQRIAEKISDEIDASIDWVSSIKQEHPVPNILPRQLL